MTDQQTPHQMRPSGPPQQSHVYPGFRPGVPNQGIPPNTQENMKSQGQVPMFPPGTVERNLSGPGVNGFPSSNVPPPSVNVRPPVRPNFQGQSFMNGPSGGPPSSQMNQPNMAMNQGQFRPAHPPPSGRPSRPQGMTGFAPPGQSGMRGPLPPNQMPGQFGMPARPVVPPVSQPRETNSAPTSEAERPNELPVPFHGQGQYSHQVGMTLTPGVTPQHSGPPSQRSSKTNSPATVNTNFDALEGQFRNTPDQDTESSASGEGSDKHPISDVEGRTGTSVANPDGPPFPSSTNGPALPPSSVPGPQTLTGPPNRAGGAPTQPVQQPHFPMPVLSGVPASQPNVASHDSGFSSTNQTPGFPHSSGTPNQPPMFQPVSSANERPRFPMPPVSANQQPGFSQPTSGGQRPSFPPSMGQTGASPGTQQFQPSSQPQRFPAPVPPNQQPGFGPPSTGGQRPGMPPSMTSQAPGFPSQTGPGQRPGFPPATSNQQPGFPPYSSSSTAPAYAPTSQQPGLPPLSMPNQRPGFPPPPSTANQAPGFTQMSTPSQRPGFQPTSSTVQRPGFPPPPTSANQQPGFPPPTSANQQSGFPPMSTPTQVPGFPPPPVSANQMPGFPPPPVSANQPPGFPPISAPSQRPGFPPPPTNFNPAGGQQMNYNATPNQYNQVPGPGQVQGKSIQEFVNSHPETNSLNANFGSMSLQPGTQTLNLMQVKNLIPRNGVETPKPNIPNDTRKVNCSPEVFRCTLNAIPQTSGLLNKARLPLGILIHPFKDLSSLPVIQSSVIVRCRSCRTYINPYVYFVDSRRWKCNLCYRVNELPDEFSFDPVSKTYGDPQRRPEIRSATIEFIAPSEYMLRPPQPAVYLYLLDVSFNAVETGYLHVFCETLLDVLDKIPGDSRTQIGFIAYDSAIHFFNLDEGLSQPQMLTVSDTDDIFLPCPDTLLVNLNESKERVIDLLNLLPTLFEGNMETSTALGAALQAGFKMTSSVGGRITVMQTNLPTVGPGALQNREDATQQAAKDVPNLGPATDFYKKLALDCSAQQIAVDLFMLNGQFADMASIECISKFSGGCVYYYPAFHYVGTPHLAEKFEVDLRRYFTRKIGFESVMRIRCSKGLSIHTFHGNFFVRSTDLLSLPNINPDAGYGMQMSIEESLTDMSTMCFQAALLYTSSKGERRIRVHTLCLPVTNQLSEVYASADQQAIVALLAKMAVDRCISSSMSDAREAIVNAVLDVLNAYASTLTSSQRAGNLCINESLRLMPLYCLALLKSRAFRINVSTRLDDRVFTLQQCKTLPVSYLIQMLHPDLYPVHTILEVEEVKKGSQEIPDLPLLQLSSANIDRFGAYLLDTGDTIYLYIGSAINEQFCRDILDKPNFASIKEGGMAELPELENQGSERLRNFLTYLLDNRPNGASFIIVREDGKYRMQFFQHFVEDRTESTMSYYEFLQHIQKQIKS